jgi:predicted AAA+ superfamily ATPase
MVSSTGEIFSSKSIKNYLKSNNFNTSQDTLLKYNEYLNQSFFISKCKFFELKGRKEMKILGKYYLTDHGFHHALIEDNILKVTKILENIVYVELLRRGYKVNVGRNTDNTEVDFVCEKSCKYKYIQVSYRLTSEKTLITISKSVPQLITENITAKAGDTITLTATILNGDKPINTGKVVFKINGKSVKDENGLVEGRYDLTMRYILNKNSKFVKSLRYIMQIRITIDYPALPEGRGEEQ